MGYDQNYCTICGTPLLESVYVSNKEPEREWLTDVVLLTTAHETEHGLELDKYFPSLPSRDHSCHLGPDSVPDNMRRVLRLDARAKENRLFELKESGERIQAMYLERCIALRNPPGAPLYLPVHRHCLEVTDRFIESTVTSLHAMQSVPSHGITSIMQLWKVLWKRFRPDNIARACLESPQDYYGGRRYRNCSYEPDDDSVYARLHEASPFSIAHLTSSLVDSLRPVTSDEASEQELSSQSWYREAIYNCHLFPWLWDLDRSVLDTKAVTGDWDWHRLAFSLARQDIQDSEDDFSVIPLQLKNRRRIWRLLAEAWEGDIP